MHIRKVDIFGFKSFGFKNTTVNFEPGLMSISGPNGSGKSNILDAIIFALGENRPKVMRVDKLKSLLHDLEGGRPGQKMTRVSVSLDNADRKIPIDSNTVTITREMNDSGENNYYLDHKKTNRSQILDLLEMANAGLHQLNVVQQGTVTRISEFTPEEKRQAIENLIGLSYFDEKKAESLKQLDDADRRLEIALAKMGEIKKRIDELEEERNLKLRFDLIEHELGRLHAISAANKLKILNNDKLSKDRSLHAITSEIKKFEEERKEVRKESHEIEAKKSQFMTEVNAYNKAKASIDSELSSAVQKFEEANSAIITTNRRLGQIESRLPDVKNGIEKIQADTTSLEFQVNNQKGIVNNCNEERKKINEEVHELDSQIQQVLKQQTKLSTRKIETDRKTKLITSKINDTQLQISKIETEINDLQNKIGANNLKSDSYHRDLQNLEIYKNRLENVTSNHKDTLSELKSRITNLNAKRNKIEKDVEDISHILEKATQAATQHETKIKVGKEVMHEDYSIAKLKEEETKLGVEGLVFEILSWDEQYERSILAVGSDWLKGFVVTDFTKLLSLADMVHSKKLPKLKIIPLDAIPNISPTLPQQQKGVIGILSDYVKCDQKFLPLKTFLFGGVVLVDSRETAFKLSKAGFKTVTLGGEFFESKAGAVVVDANSKISKLTKIITMSTSVEGLVKSIDLLKKYVAKRKLIQKKVDGVINNYKERLSVAENGLANTSNSYSELKSKISSYSNTRSQLSSRNSQLARRKDKLNTDLVKQTSYLQSLEERLSIMYENYADDEQKRVSNELAQLNDRKSILLRNQSSIVSELREKQAQLTTLTSEQTAEKSKMRTLYEELTGLNSEKHELEVRLRGLQKEKQIEEENLVRLREKEQQLISTSGTSVDTLHEFDEKLKEYNEKERTLTKEINSLERQSDSLTRDVGEMNEKITQLQKMLLGFGFDESMETFDVESIINLLEKEKHALSGSLTNKAPETYLEVSTGYRSMSTRKNELESERNSIVKFIEEIDKDKRQTFLDAFDKVDKEIREAFATMTGGNAWLELQNEDDIFSSGISYLIQFPKKTKRESTSISGGEKTLAAIVFVLALQKLKPSPFYLFDEVDAHLDAPNSEKLAKIIEQRAAGSQFIMVSLKDSVVQKAKLIYGVYPKNGVSHVVTYKDKRLPSMVS